MEESLPPGFRFHPTDEELIGYYLTHKVSDASFTSKALAVVDLNKCEPWDLPDKASMGEKEWYFFSLRDRKYPTGLRTNRATEAGYWKTTGKDKDILRAGRIIGMKKTLVFYKGRAPRGVKSNWIMHEYRLENYKNSSIATKEEWVVCRVFQKSASMKMMKPNSPVSSPESFSNHPNSSMVPEFGDLELPNLNPHFHANPNPNNALTHVFSNSNVNISPHDTASPFMQNAEMNTNLFNGMNGSWPSQEVSSTAVLPWPSNFLASNIAVNSLILKALQLKNAYQQQQPIRETATANSNYSSYLHPQIGAAGPSSSASTQFETELGTSFQAAASSSKQMTDQQQQQQDEDHLLNWNSHV